MKQATTQTDFIIVDPTEPIEFSEMLEKNYIVCKPAIARKAVAFVDKVLEQGNPQSIIENLAAIQHFIKAIEGDDRLNDYMVDELEKVKGKMQLLTGTKIEKVEAGVKYDYSVCNDSELARLEAVYEQAALELKAKKEFLRSLPAEGITAVDEQTGEVVHLYPPNKTSVTTYKVTLNAKDTTFDIDEDKSGLPF